MSSGKEARRKQKRILRAIEEEEEKYLKSEKMPLIDIDKPTKKELDILYRKAILEGKIDKYKRDQHLKTLKRIESYGGEVKGASQKLREQRLIKEARRTEEIRHKIIMQEITENEQNYFGNKKTPTLDELFGRNKPSAPPIEEPKGKLLPHQQPSAPSEEIEGPIVYSAENDDVELRERLRKKFNILPPTEQESRIMKFVNKVHDVLELIGKGNLDDLILLGLIGGFTGYSFLSRDLEIIYDKIAIWWNYHTGDIKYISGEISDEPVNFRDSLFELNDIIEQSKIDEGLFNTPINGEGINYFPEEYHPEISPEDRIPINNNFTPIDGYIQVDPYSPLDGVPDNTTPAFDNGVNPLPTKEPDPLRRPLPTSQLSGLSLFNNININNLASEANINLLRNLYQQVTRNVESPTGIYGHIEPTGIRRF